MKKKMVCALLVSVMVMSLAGCGKNTGETVSDSTETTDTASATTSSVLDTYTGKSSVELNVNPADCVSDICDYSAISLELTGDYEVTDDKITSTINNLITNMGIAYQEVTDRDTVEEGDIVDVDYTGYMDGEAFDGGSATGIKIDVSNNYAVESGNGFIDGFSEGIIGSKVGSEVSSDVAFPEDYGVESLNGKTATFKFKVNGIYKQITRDDLTDDFIAANFKEDYSFETVDDLTTYVNDYLDSQAKSNKREDEVTKIKSYMIDNCKVTVPEDYLEARLYEYEKSYQDYYCTDGQSLSEYIQSNYSSDLATAEASWRDYMEEQIKVEFIFAVIAEKEKIEIDEDEYSTYITSFTTNTSYNFEDEDAVYDYFGAGNKEEGKTYLKQLYIVNKAIDLVYGNATFTVASDDSTTKED